MRQPLMPVAVMRQDSDTEARQGIGAWYAGGISRSDTDVLDHLVIGHQRYVSLKERGLGFGA